MYVVIDIGGTATRIGLSRNLRTLNKTVKIATAQNFHVAITDITVAVQNIMGKKKPKAVMIACAGVLNKKKERLTQSPNLKNWVGKPLANTISRKLGAKTFLANDADIAGLGEAVLGAGRGKKIVGYLTIGTGVGGARIVNGQIDAFSQGLEPGYQIIIPNGRSGPIGQKGTLEAYVSGAAFVQYQPDWTRYAQLLGQGIINLIVFWSPDIVVIGGGFGVDRQKYYLKPLRSFVRDNLKIFKPVPIVTAKLGEKAALYGGLCFLRSMLKL